MKLIVGLGNVGQEYTATRHNLGFMVVDRLASELGIKFGKQPSIYKAMETAHSQEQGIILLKPHTFMNLSGNAVEPVMHYYKIDPIDVWVAHDELDLPFGTLRIRQGGSSGGHNGLKSIIEQLGENFGRIRLGIGNETLNHPIPAIDFVLQNFTKNESEQLDTVLEQTARLILKHHADGALTDTTFRLLNGTN